MNFSKFCSVFSGSSHPLLAQEICEYLGISLGKVHIERFPDGEIGVQILENVRGRDIFLVQSIVHRPNHYLMELLILVDALKRASAKSITAVIPYFAYSRQDRKDKSRVPITAKLVANLLEKAGVTRVLTMDLHTDQIQGFFDIPVDNLYARPVLVKGIKDFLRGDCVIVTPDIGSIKMARSFSRDLKADLAIVDKQRLNALEVAMDVLIGEVKGKEVVLVDDMCSTGKTLQTASFLCKKAGATKVLAAVTHYLPLDSCFLENSAIDKVLISNTIPLPDNSSPFLKVFSIAKLFSLAISSILEDKSISSLFETQNLEEEYSSFSSL